ncbi:MAG TPA: hypothetical protein VGN86_17225 [Pyrinomonadaceae bacterium]|nr:hypothetical protein [Pyrinomonadaceae bacterium]
MKKLLFISILLVTFTSVSFAQDPGWPRQKVNQSGSLVYYQPQFAEWDKYKSLTFSMAFSLTPAGAKAVVGVVDVHALTNVNVDDHTVLISDFVVTDTHFPSLEPGAASQMGQLVKTFLPPGSAVTISLDRLVTTVNKTDAAPTVRVRNDPPQIFVSNRPAVLVQADGQPVLAEIKDTKLQFVVNSNWPLFFDKSQSNYYLFTGKRWLKTPSMNAPWSVTTTLPKEMSKLVSDPQWGGLAKAISPVATDGGAVPTVFYSTGPAEVILFQGPPVYSQIPGTQLVFASNTDADLFVHNPTQQYYYLAAGRWFRSSTLQGPWTYATEELPADFAQIPLSSSAARVLVSVPGTEQAKDAVLLAQIPTTVTVNPAAAAAQAKVTYSGDPQFKPIEGTSLAYATNTSDKVIQVADNAYYLCLQGIWFVSTTAQGPWQTASSIPQEVYSIPPSSPVYNVTYVTQTTTSDGSVQASYTSGYVGSFVVGVTVGAILAGGTGYYYPPYLFYPPIGYPIYHPYAATYGVGSYYNSYTGAYGVGAGVYGPYGGAAAGAAYNPYTGTYARGATAYGPYGSASVGQAYNPYTGTYARGASASTAYGTTSAAQAYNPRTGTYAQTRQQSSPYGQWGTSTVSNGNNAIQTGHATTSQGTVAGARTSSGAAAVGANTAYGSGGAVKTANGDMYATKDGNVYKNTNGNWQSYNNGNWNSANSGQAQQARSSASTAQRSAPNQEMNQQFQDRQRGAAQSEQFQNMQRSGGFSEGGGGRGGGGGFGGGGRGGGGGGRRR